MTRGERRSWFPGLLALIGGGAISAGASLTWLKVGGGVSIQAVSVMGTPKGSDLMLGQVALGAGAAVILLGLLLLAIRRARRPLGFLVIIGGGVAIAAAYFVASSPRDRYIDFAVEKGAPAGQSDEVRASLANLFEVSGQEADLGVGVYVVIGGGAMSVVGGLTAIFGRRKSRPAEEAVEPSQPEPEGLPDEWLAARAKEATARSATVEEPPARELVTQPAGPPMPDPPPESDDAARWRMPLPDEVAEGTPAEAAARSATVEEPPVRELVTQPAGPPMPDAPPEADDAAPWRRPLPDQVAESPPEEERVAAAEEIAAPSDAVDEPPSREFVTQPTGPPPPAERAEAPKDPAAWTKPLPDVWAAKPAKRRRRRRP